MSHIGVETMTIITSGTNKINTIVCIPLHDNAEQTFLLIGAIVSRGVVVHLKLLRFLFPEDRCRDSERQELSDGRYPLL